MTTHVECPACRQTNRVERRYCHACATELTMGPCPDCGFVNHPGERYCGGCARDVLGVSPPASARAQTGAERRQMTVMFCDMVGSTALSSQLDPEDLRSVITRFQGACAAEVARHDGYIARYMGDGMLVYFGYPRAHEDSAERAVRAGLAIVAAVQALSDLAVEPEVRVGIATGRVVVGDIIGEGASEERAVVGETPNLAARLQGLAAPNTVVVSPRTRRLVRGTFSFVDLGTHPLKGFPEPVRAWRADDVRRGASFIPIDLDLPLVGRDLELSILVQRWGQATEADGCVVSVAGDAGAGKTRLLDGFAADLQEGEEPAHVLRYACGQHASSVTLGPIVDQISRAAGIGVEDPIEARLDKTRAFVESWSSDVDRDVAGVSAVLSLDESNETSPAERRRTMLDAVCRYVVALTNSSPVLVMFEDFQSSDPATREFVESLVARTAAAPIMLIVSHRAGFDPAWRGAEGLTTLSLGRLKRGPAAELVQAAAGEIELPPDVVEEILSRADGVPGFLVELTRAVIARGDDEQASGPLSRASVPETLHDSLAAQLDRVGEHRRLAQTAAAIGREFSRELLVRVARISATELDAGLEALAAAGIITGPVGEGGAMTYGFRHALLCDLAYESLLRSDLRHLHHEIATVLLEQLPAAATADPIATARHLSRADRRREASEWWARAAERAASQASFSKSVAHWQCAISMLEPVVDRTDEEDADRLANLYIELATRQRTFGGSDELDGADALQKAEELVAPFDMPATLSHIYFSRGNIYFSAGDVEMCAASHAKALELAERSDSALAQVRALGGLMDVKLLVGDRKGAIEPGERCVQLAIENGFNRIAAANAAALGFAYYWTGAFDEAVRVGKLAERIGTEVGAPRALLIAYNVLILAACERLDFAQAHGYLDERDERIGNDAGLPKLWFVDHRVYRVQGRWTEGHEYVRAGMEAESPGSSEPNEITIDRWGAAFHATLLAESTSEEFEVRLDGILRTVDGGTPNTIHWLVIGTIEAIVHRQAWHRLADALELFEPLRSPDMAPLYSQWMEAGRAALAWSQAPEDPRRISEVQGALDEARKTGAGSIQLMLEELLDGMMTSKTA